MFHSAIKVPTFDRTVADDPRPAGSAFAPRASRQLVKLTGTERTEAGTVHLLAGDRLDVDLEGEFAPGSRVQVEGAGFANRSATVLSQARGRVALHLARPLSAAAFTSPRGENGFAARAPRFPVSRSARLRVGSELVIARMIDIAPGGARIEVSEPLLATLLTPGTVALITLAGCLSPRLARIRWRRDCRAGLAFDTQIALPELRAVLAASGLAADEPAGTP